LRDALQEWYKDTDLKEFPVVIILTEVGL